MKIVVEMEFGRYYRFLARCDRTSRQYEILKAGVEVGTAKDGAEHMVTFACELEDAKALHFLAGTICPEAVLDIVTSINLACQG